MVVVEHHIDVSGSIWVDRVIVLGRPDASSPTGAVIADGKPDEVFAETATRRPPAARGPACVCFPLLTKAGSLRTMCRCSAPTNLSFGRGTALGVGINLEFIPAEERLCTVLRAAK